MRARLVLPGFLLLAFTAASASELTVGTAADLEAVATSWDIGNADWSKKCRIDLHRTAAQHGRRIVVGPNCARDFPVMAGVASWEVMEGETIDLLDSSGKRVLRFLLKDGDELYSVEPPVDGIFTIGLAL